MGLTKRLRRLKPTLYISTTSTSPSTSRTSHPPTPGSPAFSTSSGSDSDTSFGCVSAKAFDELQKFDGEQFSKPPSRPRMSDREYSEGDFLNPRAPPGGISPGSRSINAPSRSGNHGGPEKEGEGKRIILKQVELPCEFCGCMVLAGEEEMGKDAAGLERLCYKCAKSKWVMCVNCGTENTQHPMGRCKTCCRESARLPEGGSMGCSDEDTPPEVPPKDEKWKRHARCFSDPSGAVMTPSEVVGRRHQSTSAMGVPPRKKGGRREEEFRGLG